MSTYLSLGSQGFNVPVMSYLTMPNLKFISLFTFEISFESHLSISWLNLLVSLSSISDANVSTFLFKFSNIVFMLLDITVIISFVDKSVPSSLSLPLFTCPLLSYCAYSVRLGFRTS